VIAGAPLSMQGRVVVVTGAAGAIGSETARELGRRGAQVVAMDIEDSSRVVDEIGVAGGQALALEADLRDELEVTRAFGVALEWRGRVDSLVNMVGVYYAVPRVPFWEIDPGTWDEMFQSNVRTVFLSCRAASGPMREARQGRIVNVSSNVSVFGMGNFMHYVASKAAIVGMSRAMARELGPYGIAVNAVAPGLVRTERGMEELAPEYFEAVAGGQMLRTTIEVSDIVNAVAFLAGDESRLITGQTLLVNGGASAGPF
jgi:3-oxoacyl-[acyl-carrier protein] reductase